MAFTFTPLVDEMRLGFRLWGKPNCHKRPEVDASDAPLSTLMVSVHYAEHRLNKNTMQQMCCAVGGDNAIPWDERCNV